MPRHSATLGVASCKGLLYPGGLERGRGSRKDPGAYVPCASALTAAPSRTIVSQRLEAQLVNPVDARVIALFNQFAQRSWAFDAFFVLCSNYLLRAAGIVPLYWWAWFDKSNDHDKGEKRRILIFGIMACVLALILSRTIAVLLPFRMRPLYDPDLQFKAPYGQPTHMLAGWSAFPSDHAAVYFALAICLWFVSRRLGLFALCWTFFVTCLPRVYLGLHYPSDIVAGALLGIGVAFLSTNAALRSAMTGPVMRFQERHPGPFYALLFLFTVQLATAFESVLVFRDYFYAIAHHAMHFVR